MYCSKCGTKIDDANFCGKCGAPQKENIEQEPTPKAESTIINVTQPAPKKRKLGLLVALILIAFVGFAVYRSTISVERMREENATLQTDWNHFVNANNVGLSTAKEIEAIKEKIEAFINQNVVEIAKLELRYRTAGNNNNPVSATKDFLALSENIITEFQAIYTDANAFARTKLNDADGRIRILNRAEIEEAYKYIADTGQRLTNLNNSITNWEQMIAAYNQLQQELRQ